MGYKNLKICEEIPAGISFDELVEILGPPTHETKTEIDYWYSFNTSSIAAGLIRVRGRKERNTIVELRCSEDSPSNWNMDRK